MDKNHGHFGQQNFTMSGVYKPKQISELTTLYNEGSTMRVQQQYESHNTMYEMNKPDSGYGVH